MGAAVDTLRPLESPFGSRKFPRSRRCVAGRVAGEQDATSPAAGRGGILSPVVSISPPIRLTSTAAAKRVVVQIRFGLTQSAAPNR